MSVHAIAHDVENDKVKGQNEASASSQPGQQPEDAARRRHMAPGCQCAANDGDPPKAWPAPTAQIINDPADHDEVLWKVKRAGGEDCGNEVT